MQSDTNEDEGRRVEGEMDGQNDCGLRDSRIHFLRGARTRHQLSPCDTQKTEDRRIKYV